MSKSIIRRDSISEQLFNILKDELESGKYESGEKMMSESSLAQKYDVSRLTVRSAMARLQALGYIETRNGEGSFVKKRDADSILQEVSSLVTQPQMLNDVSDFRRLIDIECVRLAIIHADKEGLKRLYDASEAFQIYMNDMKVLDEEAKRNIVELDFKFHLTMCELSGNSLYPLAYKAAQEAIKQHIYTNVISRWFFNRLDSGKKVNYIERFIMTHRNLYNAVESGNFQKAKKLAASHIDPNEMKLPEIKN